MIQKILTVMNALQCETFSIYNADGGISVEWGCEYSAPELTMSGILMLAAFLGCDPKDLKTTGTYSSRGCETCDWGSDYGHDCVLADRKFDKPFRASVPRTYSGEPKDVTVFWEGIKESQKFRK